jgi:crossover junction endodeoxyribonuclease RuvC
MRILGIDPGSESTGYGIIESDGSEHHPVVYGAIRTDIRSPFHERLLEIHRELTNLLESNGVDSVAVEEVFYAANVQSALKLGHARGVALLAAAGHGISLFEYSPLEIKNSIVGYGRAEKGQVQAMVKFLLKLHEIPTPDDAADALAVAICHAHHYQSGTALVARRRRSSRR